MNYIQMNYYYVISLKNVSWQREETLAQKKFSKSISEYLIHYTVQKDQKTIFLCDYFHLYNMFDCYTILPM